MKSQNVNEKYIYYYETHVHSNECSACAASSAQEQVRMHKEMGYSGLVLTNHFIHGNTCVPKELSWEQRMKMYYDAYLSAKEEGEKLDFDVFFGLEHAYGNGKEVLIYGIDLDFLLRHPELDNADIDTYAKLVHEAGGILVHAHPRKKAGYIIEGILPNYDVCDGIEVYNASQKDEFNQLAYQDALEKKKIMTSGSDCHHASTVKGTYSGHAFNRRIRTSKEFVQALVKQEGIIIWGDKNI